ncbi:MAG: ECF-type sigma factor [Thermoanaerobaculia bacterium]|nr:ECF-type sigma factor [Thermoanaerobaculia bacterium]
MTQLLERHAGGDAAAFDELVPIVYDELRKLARSQRRRSGGNRAPLDTTVLAHEAYLRLARSDGTYRHRGHFFAVAAVAMRQLLVDEARRHGRVKRGAGARRVGLDGLDIPVSEQYELVIAIDEALERLEELDPRLRSVVEMRYILGLSEPETAKALDISERTVRRAWVKARAWLEVELGSK